MKKNILLSVCLAFALSATAEVRLPQLVSTGMVLQRNAPVKIWGWAAPQEKVSVRLLKARQEAVANAQGEWEVTLKELPVGGPYTITITASNTLTVKDVLVGDVWICSGQSNMETPVSRVMSMFGDEIRNYSNPNIHYVKIPLTYNFHAPQTDVPPCNWVDLTPETAQDYSAVAYFFAKEMYEKTGVPVGIINSSVGGSPAEAWISEEALQPFPALINDMRICQSDEFVAEMQRLGALPGRRWHTVLNGQDKGLNDAVKWSSPACNDRDWQTTDLLDNSWGRNGLYPANGVFWFRKEVEIPADWANQAVRLFMGRIVDADSVFVNGVFVGTTGYQYPPRNYSVPPGILKAGKNLIAVRLVSSNGFPEFVKNKPYKMVFNNREISLEGQWKYKTGALMPAASGGGITFQYKPTGLYNAMIYPLKRFAAKGFLWYQGESNTGRAAEYYDLMSALIRDWRGLWQAELPFLIVQLANFMEPALLQQNSGWADLRDVQLQLAQTIPNTGLAVAIDLGEWNDIHPLNKKDVGKRLALQAQKLAYGEKIVSDGPVYQSSKIEGNKIVISFKEGTNNLRPVDTLKGFAIAGADGVFKLAKATMQGKQIIVWCDEISAPTAVRYAWANNPDGANLYNTEGLPASPFQLTIGDNEQR
jgi:sialate O-acetylesterase